MAIVRWNPIREMDVLRNEMDRVFDDFAGSTRNAYPAIRVWENGNSFTVQAVVPGLDRDSLDIQASANGLSIGGKTAITVPEGVAIRHSEYGNAEFRRTLQLANRIDTQGVRANYTDGILTITLPKLESQQVFKVELDQPQLATSEQVINNPEQAALN